ncbi:MAG: hypothetical protein GC200_08025 [Tepidisphaera sp.]|nr:hypothetical protein [Tepidisphaera sp.]
MRTCKHFSNNRFRTSLVLSAFALLPGLALAQPSQGMDPADKAKIDALKAANKGVLQPGPPGVQNTGKVTSEWSIVIATARGEGAQEAIQGAAEKVRTKGNLPGAYAEQRGDAWVVAYGHYPSFADSTAQHDLETIKNIEIDSAKPFAGAVLAPPITDHIAGGLPQYDLANLKAREGKRAAFTLQVGVYDPGDKPTDEDLKLVRETAEQAAAELRREGEQAYYYHGPRRSMVTIGAFSQDEVKLSRSGTPTLSPRIKELQKRFPLNLVNGKGLMVAPAKDESKGHLQPSFLVGVP